MPSGGVNVIACHRTPDGGCFDTQRSGRPPWAHSIEVWRRGTLVGGAIGTGIGGVISGDTLFGRHQVAVVDMAARLEEPWALLIAAQWDPPFLRSLGVEPVPRAERVAPSPRPRPTR